MKYSNFCSILIKYDSHEFCHGTMNASRENSTKVDAPANGFKINLLVFFLKVSYTPFIVHTIDLSYRVSPTLIHKTYLNLYSLLITFTSL